MSGVACAGWVVDRAGLEIAEKASSSVAAASGPLIALAVALLILTIAVLLAYFVINRTPRD